MRFSVEASAAAEHAAFAARAVARKSTIPILGCILLSCSGGRLQLRSSSLDIWAQTAFDGECEDSAGVAVDADLFRRFCAVAPAGSKVEGALADGMLTLKAGRTRAAFPTLPAEDFPPVAEKAVAGLDAREIDAEAFGAALRGCLKSASSDETRYYICGVLFEEKGLVATDGHRLHHFELGGFSGRSILPRQHVAAVVEVLADGGSFGISPDAWVARAGPFTLAGKCVDGSFPDWERVQPPAPSLDALFARGDLEQALKAVSFHDERSRAVLMQAEAGAGAVTVSMRRQAGGTAESSFPADVKRAFRTGFNSAYVADALSAMPDAEIAAHFGDGGTPAKLWPSNGSAFLGRSAVIMPQRM